jgi:glycosyltransferase involved in cell wall biosynthesis
LREIGVTTNSLLVTILINNYNYGRFLREAIDSALNQTYPNLEVIVVDDGSSDESRELIASYGKTLTPIFKDNGGQASAFNAGIAASRGELICFLDADDFLHPGKVESVIPHFRPGSLIYHRLQLLPGPGIYPESVGPGGNFYSYVQKYRFIPFVAAPTSALAISRDLALRLIPLPTRNVRSSADDFVVKGSALLGNVFGIPDVLATYRIHGANAWYGTKDVRSAAFMRELEGYLNAKLVCAGKESVVDFRRSMFARDAVPQNCAALASLALSVFQHHQDLVTFRFMLRTLARAGRCMLV